MKNIKAKKALKSTDGKFKKITMHKTTINNYGDLIKVIQEKIAEWYIQYIVFTHEVEVRRYSLWILWYSNVATGFMALDTNMADMTSWGLDASTSWQNTIFKYIERACFQIKRDYYETPTEMRSTFNHR